MLPLLLRSTAVLLLGLALMPVFRRRSAALRHAVLAGTVAAALLMPLLSTAMPQVRAPLLAPPSVMPATPQVASNAPATAEPVVVAEAAVPGARVSAPSPARIPFAEVWIAGIAVFLAVLLLGLRRMDGILRGATPLDDAEWRRQLEGARRELGVETEVELLLNEAIAVPVVSRIRRPAILLPVAALEWQPDRCRVVLLHELMHLRRRDGAVEYLTRLASAVYWFNPVVWLAARRLRLERELACDEAVVRSHVPAADYADHLVDIAASVAQQRLQPALAMAQRGSLERRVRAILTLPAERPVNRAVKAVLAGGVVLLVLAVSAMRPVQRGSAATADTLELRIEPDRPVSWIGALRPGDTLTVRAAMGDIAVDSSPDGQVVMTAYRKVGPRGVGADTRIGVIRSAGRVAICSIHFDHNQRVAPCTVEDDWGRGSVDDNHVSFQVTVPTGVHVIALTGNGDVKALRIHGDVTATTGAGSAYLETDGAASLEALSGAMNLILRDGGRGGPVVLHGMHAQIHVSLPDGAGADVNARTGRGLIAMHDRDVGDGVSPAVFKGALGRGGRSITASLEKGDIRIGRP